MYKMTNSPLPFPLNGCIFEATETPTEEVTMVTEAQVWEALKGCYDPEIPVNIVDLGLIYEVKVEDGDVRVRMTMTAPGCPLSGWIARQAEEAIRALEGVREVHVEMVWDPPWTLDRMSEEAKKALGLA